MTITKGRAKKIKTKVKADTKAKAKGITKGAAKRVQKRQPTKNQIETHIQRIRDSILKRQEIHRLQKERQQLSLLMKAFTVEFGRRHENFNRVWLQGIYKTLARWNRNDRHAKGYLFAENGLEDYLLPKNQLLDLTALEDELEDEPDPMIKAALTHLKKKYSHLITENQEDEVDSVKFWEAVEAGEIPEHLVDIVAERGFEPTEEELSNPSNYILTPTILPKKKRDRCGGCGNVMQVRPDQKCPTCGHLE